LMHPTDKWKSGRYLVQRVCCADKSICRGSENLKSTFKNFETFLVSAFKNGNPL